MSLSVSGAVYGTITVGALLAAESSGHETYLDTVIGVVIALILYWLAHSYAALAGRRLREGTHLTLKALGAELIHELGMLAGAALPLVAVALSWAAGAKLGTALTIGVLTAAAVIVTLEVVSGIRAKLTGGELIGQVAIGALLGCLVFVLKVVLH